MGRVKLLDCTLRDGGYVNNWNFRYDVICDVLKNMFNTGVDIIEAGFVRDVDYDKNKAIFSDLNLVDEILNKNGIEKNNSELAVMAEIAHPIPLDKIVSADKTTCDIVRVIVWKSKHDEMRNTVDALQESFEYCKGIVDKGYKLCVQPNRTDQYSDEEFENMLSLFAQLDPYAIYVVDSWGTMYSSQVLHYMEIANRILPTHIAVGFHGHNNMMQAFGTAERIVERQFDRDIIIDASVDGIGRGAGNLNLELIARFMNNVYGCKYNLEPIYEVYDQYIKELAQEYDWGSSFPFFLSAVNNANPNYAANYAKDMTLKQMQLLYGMMENDDAVLYTDELADNYRRMIEE